LQDHNTTNKLVAIVISTLGIGFSAALRSFLTSLVPSNEVALLYTLMTQFSSIGSLIGVPALALTFSTGINIGGFALGLPFFFAATMYALSGLSIWSINSAPKAEEESNGEDAA
jgi:hypothetical protein